MALRFDGRVAVITGGGRGLGRAYAQLLGSLGCKVVVNDNGSVIRGEGSDENPAQDVVDAIRAAGGEAIANTDSVATPEGGRAIIQSALDTWGRIDVLIHNAGNVRYGTIRELSDEDLNAVLDVHLKGAFHVVRAAMGPMCDAGYGRMVLTSSIGGVYGNKACVNYAMAKSGMIGLNNVIALEGEEFNVKSNVIVPAAVTRMADGLDTSQYPPMGPELVAPMVGWLAHENCSVSGEIYAAVAGRMTEMYIAETKGAYQPAWTVDDVDAKVGQIRDKTDPQIFGLHGHVDHLVYSFGMASGAEG
ncbi:SDR family NAD(P)-dependent oxidoreductase [Novosphingobium aquae]|uniref:SDR family NAD(P)-dependent oxidoreductase n=1 Tax=Novosphingobium aquae TaxID=3133435 RepID=A0ABU8SDF9_9SPHN